ncbi:MAG TPA: NAD(P)/FAD-dependent oxidoreductase [Gemmatimonadales bacterium]|nr:NAD(P)/FAD-dependent oxidoreductase [Gemmatimonadales bacterium]
MTDLPQQIDALIAGAGPAGSASAVLLAQAGYSVLAIDRARFPRDKACAEYMSPEAVRILSRLGVVERLERTGAVALEGMKVTASRGATAHGVFARSRHQPFRPTGLSVSRRVLDHVLVDAARSAGAQIMERAALEELLYDQGGVTGAVIRDSAGHRHAVHARLTVGADGLRSIVARRMGRRTHTRPRRVAFVTHVAGVQQMGSSAELHFGRTGYAGLNQIAEGRANVAVVVPAARAASARGRVREFFFEALAEFTGVRERVEAGTIVKPILVTGPFAARSRRVTAPGCLLVGDAADFYDPVTGDGIYSALRGAELVAESMIPGLAYSGFIPAESFRTYRQLRRRAFAGKWMMERLTRALMHFPSIFDRTVDRLGRSHDMAHTAIGVAGGFVPLREMLKLRFIARVVF